MIIKRTSSTLYTKGSIDGIKITEQDKKKFQHDLSNYAKKALKARFDKGPDNVKVSLAENMIIFTCEKFMTKYEKFVLTIDFESMSVLKEARLKSSKSFVEDDYEIDNFIKERLDANVIGYTFDVCLEDDFAIWVMILDKSISITR